MKSKKHSILGKKKQVEKTREGSCPGMICRGMIGRPSFQGPADASRHLSVGEVKKNTPEGGFQVVSRVTTDTWGFICMLN